MLIMTLQPYNNNSSSNHRSETPPSAISISFCCNNTGGDYSCNSMDHQLINNSPVMNNFQSYYNNTDPSDTYVNHHHSILYPGSGLSTGAAGHFEPQDEQSITYMTLGGSADSGSCSQAAAPPPLLELLPTMEQSTPPSQPPLQIQINVPPSTTITGTSGNNATPQQQIQRTFPVVYDAQQIPKNVYGQCYLNIIEQPINRIRYRYRSEKGSHGGLNGANSSPIKKTYPTIKLENYHHSAPVYIRASLATNEDHPRAHVHKLMGKHCSQDGSCTLPLSSDNMTATFQNLGILFIGKKEVPDILFKRKLNDLRYSSNDVSLKLRERLQEESEREAKDLNLNSVRIGFEAYMLQNEALYPIAPMVYSRPIANQKSPDSGELKIVRINRYHGSVAGGDEIYLLCEKVNKKEIRVRFFEILEEEEEEDSSQQLWEAFGDFNESDVHHQVAIVFRTPPYRNQNITKPRQVYFQLYRQRDGEYSEPRTFIYKPKTFKTTTNSKQDEDDDKMLLLNSNELQECILTRIKMENQPPGFKRKKYHYQQNSTTETKHKRSTTSSMNGYSKHHHSLSPVNIKEEFNENHQEMINLSIVHNGRAQYSSSDNNDNNSSSTSINHHQSIASNHQQTSFKMLNYNCTTPTPSGSGGGLDFAHLDSMWPTPAPPQQPTPSESTDYHHSLSTGNYQGTNVLVHGFPSIQEQQQTTGNYHNFHQNS